MNKVSRVGMEETDRISVCELSFSVSLLETLIPITLQRREQEFLQLQLHKHKTLAHITNILAAIN